MENNGFKIFFSDLNEDAQKRLLDYVGAKDASECNWDMDIVPLTEFFVEKDDEENSGINRDGTLVLRNYQNEEYDTNVPLKDIRNILITIVSGDEIAHITMKNGDMKHIDVADLCHNYRMVGFPDGSYEVDRDNLDEWLNRKDSYDYLCGGHGHV